MDPKTGRIVECASPEEALRRGLVPIKAAELAAVARMTPEQRKRWAERRLAGPKPDPGKGPAFTRYETQAERNAVKRQRRARRSR